MHEVTVTLAEREYKVKPLPLEATKVWREALGKPLDEIMSILLGANELMIDNPADVARLIVTVKDTLLHAPDFIFEAVCAYAPNIQSDRAYILKNGYDYEVMDAFIEVVKLAYPFGGLVAAFTGLRGRTISKNGRSRNMEELTSIKSKP